jgi:DNA-binding transcriptional MocR family regulator
MNNSHLNIKGADVALRIEQMLQELITCIQAETHALRAHDKKASTTHLKKKKALLLRYQSLHSELSESTKDIDMSDKNIKSYLKKTIAEFDNTLKENAIAITTGKKAATRLLTRILEKARQAVAHENPHYDARGQFVQKQSQPFSTPSKLNETY